MSEDVRELVRRAAGPEPASAPEDAILQRARRRAQRRWLAQAGMSMIAVVAVVLVAVQLGGSRVDLLPADEGQPEANAAVGRADLPAPGDVIPVLLDDDTPVFVTRRQADGEDATDVAVVEALEPAGPRGISELVGWCDASRTFDSVHRGRQGNRLCARRRSPVRFR